MLKGQFAPGKRVLLLRPANDCVLDPNLTHLVGTEQVLDRTVAPYEMMHFAFQAKHWVLRGVSYPTREYDEVAWPQRDMFLLDPDETPEQSAEAMRKLHETTTAKKELV